MQTSTEDMFVKPICQKEKLKAIRFVNVCCDVSYRQALLIFSGLSSWMPVTITDPILYVCDG